MNYAENDKFFIQAQLNRLQKYRRIELLIVDFLIFCLFRIGINFLLARPVEVLGIVLLNLRPFFYQMQTAEQVFSCLQIKVLKFSAQTR